MATDALALMDHLGWKKAHVFGHSMGAMIACKLDVMAPHRLCSLALLNVTRGGFQCFPKVDAQMLSLAFRFLRAKTPEERALVDLETHYTKVLHSLSSIASSLPCPLPLPTPTHTRKPLTSASTSTSKLLVALEARCPSPRCRGSCRLEVHARTPQRLLPPRGAEGSGIAGVAVGTRNPVGVCGDGSQIRLDPLRLIRAPHAPDLLQEGESKRHLWERR
eukprot:XP_008677733.1 uncharacterized LOC100502149 isoform X2 [Zea mays]